MFLWICEEKEMKLSDQVKSYILSKADDFSASNTHRQGGVSIDNDKEILSISDNHNEDFIRSDQLWAYLLNVNPNPTPNFRKMICYIFSIPCSNSYVETTFSQVKHTWSDYRNKMDVGLVSAELKVRINSNYFCERFHKHILSQTELLEETRKNAKYE